MERIFFIIQAYFCFQGWELSLVIAIRTDAYCIKFDILFLFCRLMSEVTR